MKSFEKNYILHIKEEYNRHPKSLIFGVFRLYDVNFASSAFNKKFLPLRSGVEGAIDFVVIWVKILACYSFKIVILCNCEVDMASITIRNIPNSILSRIRTLSEVEKRSINSELLMLIEKALNNEVETKETGKIILSKESQIKIWESLSGTWEDTRSTEEIVEDIYSYRTKGRAVDL